MTFSANVTLESTTKPDVAVIVPLVVVVVLIVMIIIALALSPKGSIQKLVTRITRRSRTPILPLTELPQPEPTFIQRHLEGLRKWQKPTGPPAPASQPSLLCDGIQMADLPALSKPSPVARPPNRPTYQQWKERYQNRSPTADERHRYAREKKTRVPNNGQYWRRVYEELQTRRPWWEKLKEKMGF
ncbi:hypothetical protein BDW02DRAFT_567073 [Decorospora gaudefroyi]|uniref:Uncharacterized protein n=1 Tax=Decorospora gaudefroyi TaxID=184978 RepID=A0A6A5KLM3_9PLEO|nr:hypothetical protein BDW02DRAFT_567073 [Decorospora gaudefroyi]